MPRPAPWSTNRRVIKELDRAFWTAFNGEGTDAEKMETYITLASAIRMGKKPSRKQLKDRWRNSRKRLVNVVNVRSTSLTTNSRDIATTHSPPEPEPPVLHGQRAEGTRTPVVETEYDALMRSLSEQEVNAARTTRDGGLFPAEKRDRKDARRAPRREDLNEDRDDVEDVI